MVRWTSSLLFIAMCCAAPGSRAQEASDEMLFVCKTYAQQDFDPVRQDQVVPDVDSGPQSFAVAAARFPETNPPDSLSTKVSASLYLFNDFRGAITSRRHDDGTLSVGTASAGHRPEANHEDLISIFTIDEATGFALAAIVQSEWLHGDKGRFLEKTYLAKCKMTRGPTVVAQFEAFDP
ncbi:hypothetical protein [Sphingopyxis panaciterrae]